MPLARPADREPIQTRKMEVSSYRRSDGKWDVEGRLRDTAAHSFQNNYRGTIKPGVPIHDMWIRLTLDHNIIITSIDVAMDGTPYAICPGVETTFQTLKGACFLMPAFCSNPRAGSSFSKIAPLSGAF